MSDEIKEILDRLEGRKNWYLHQQRNNSVFNDEDYMAYMVLDYITNLQEENKYLNNEINNITDYARDLEDYKSRNEKAIEYIEHYAIEDEDYSRIYSIEERELLQILRGDK